MRLNLIAKEKELGYTLIELLIVVAIIGILASVAIPAYQGSVIRGKRSVAQSGLLDLANRQEQFYLNNKTYTTSMNNLGYTAALVFADGGNSAVALDQNQGLVVSTSTARVYFVKINAATAAGYSIAAVPQLGQADDTECGILTLTSTGARTESGTATAADCW